MRALLSMVFLGIIVLVGCEESDKSVVQADLRGAQVVASSVDGCSAGACYVTLTITIDDTVSGYDYWARAIYGRDTATGNRQSDTVITGDRTIYLTIPYFSNFDQYTTPSIDIYRCGSKCRPGRTGGSYTSGKITVPFDMSTVTNFYGYATDCVIYCCTDSTEHAGWYHVGCGGIVFDAITASAKIETRWGKLCGESTNSSEYAHRGAHLNLSNSGRNIFAQMGYLRYRYGGEIDSAFYVEIQGNNYDRHYGSEFIVPIYGAPAEGREVTYRIEVDTTSGNWSYFIDGGLVDQFGDFAWVNTFADELSVVGEIYGRESDIPGTTANPCEFSSYLVQFNTGQWAWPQFDSTHVRNPDTLEWSTHLAAASFSIWDKRLQP